MNLMANRLCLRRFMSYQIKGESLNPKIKGKGKKYSKPREIEVPYQFTWRQVYHIRGRYG